MIMKNKIFILFSIVITGCSAKAVKPEFRNPKFKVGDCIRSYDSFDEKILEIMENDYGVLIGLNCEECSKNSRSAYPIEITDKHSVKIDCPK